MSGIDHKPDLFLLYKIFHLFFIHPPGDAVDPVQSLKDTFSISGGSAHITAYALF